MTGVEKLIDQLKALYGVQTDQALAEKLGSTKSAVANWRRRGSIPASVQQQAAREYGPFYDGTFLEEPEAHVRLFDVPRGLALYVYDRERAGLTAFPSKATEMLVWGFNLGDIERVMRRHIAKTFPDLEGGELLIESCISQIDARTIPELEQLLAQVRADHLYTFASQ